MRLYLEMNGVEVGLSLSPALNANQTHPFQFGDQLRDAHAAHSHVLGQTILPRKTRVIVPSVAQKQAIGDFRSRRDCRASDNEVRDLRKTIPRDGIARVELQVSLFDGLPDLFHV